MAAKSTFTMAKRDFRASAADVERAVRGVHPTPVRGLFVVVSGRRYPPKQVMSLVTGLPVSAFTSHHAVRTLRRLGFAVGRRGHGTSVFTDPMPSTGDDLVIEKGASAAARDDADDLQAVLRQHVGYWVAVRGDELLVAAPDAKGVIGWLSQHGERAESMFRVPADEGAASGVAPL